MPKEFILKEIEENLKFVKYNILADRITIHTDNGDRYHRDLPRTFYTIFTLSRLWKNNLGNIKKEEVESLINKSFLNKWSADKKEVNDLDLIFVCLYGMRACKNFGFGNMLNRFYEIFNSLDIKHVYHSPISMYVFMSAYQEIQQINSDQFWESIYNNCIKAFEVLLYRVNVKQLPFYFSEFSYFSSKIPTYLWEDVQKYVKDNFNKEYLQGDFYSSGVAKTLEYFANVGDMDGFNLGLEFLEKRKYKHLNGFKNTFLPECENIFTEQNNSMYVMLDTNTHLINAYLNLHENNFTVVYEKHN